MCICAAFLCLYTWQGWPFILVEVTDSGDWLLIGEQYGRVADCFQRRLGLVELLHVVHRMVVSVPTPLWRS